MDKIAEASSYTAFARIEPAAGLPKVGDGRQLTVDRSCGVPARVERIASLLSRVFVLESCIHITDQMVVVVVADHNLLDLAVFAHLAPEIFVESVKVIL